MTRPHEEKIKHLTFQMLPVQGGAFRMGSKKDDSEAFRSEKPDHEVTVRDFYIGQYPVTQDLWFEIMGENPSFFRGDRRPVESISWNDIVKGDPKAKKRAFLDVLNELTEKSRPEGWAYRLPSEAEWEYAARGGIQTFAVSPIGEDGGRGGAYSGGDKMKEVGWFEDNSHGETKPVGLKAPNALGLFDMSGNVWEWCEDDWHDDYEGAPKDSSAWVDRPERGSDRVHRGGSWDYAARNCRSACRSRWPPGGRAFDLGFRLALAPQSVGSLFGHSCEQK